MPLQKSKYAVLRDGNRWQPGQWTSLDISPEGGLTLARVPGLNEGTEIGPIPTGDVAHSGLTIGEHGALYLSDTDADRVVFYDPVCKYRLVIPGLDNAGDATGHFSKPKGVLVVPPNRLYVADSGNGRVQIFSLPDFYLVAIWDEPFLQPVDLAVDGRGRIYVLDRGLKRVLRLSQCGESDTEYNATFEDNADLVSPMGIAMDGSDTLFVSDNGERGTAKPRPEKRPQISLPSVLRFDQSGFPLEPLPIAAGMGAVGVLAAMDDRVYVAQGNRIHVFHSVINTWLGEIPHYRGPISALAVDETGNLCIKKEAGSEIEKSVICLTANTACVAKGKLMAGPFDAGLEGQWERAWVDAEVPDYAGLKLQLFLSDTANPLKMIWSDARSLDTLVPPPSANERDGTTNTKPFESKRYLWLRLEFSSLDGRQSPMVSQVHARTRGESYLDYLPDVYRREDSKDRFLYRWLALFQSELGDVELELNDMHWRFDPNRASEDSLEWLASWVGFELPLGRKSDELRKLILQAHDLYAWRGTKYGLQRVLWVYAGIWPVVLESHHQRRLWSLGHSWLGIDTGLMTVSPHGAIVPDFSKPRVLGGFTVGQTGPLAHEDLGEPVFSECAHLFTVYVPKALVPDDKKRRTIEDIIEENKPAHTDYRLCLVEPYMRVGVQAWIGVDSIVAGPAPMTLTSARLGTDTLLGNKAGFGVTQVEQKLYA